MLRIYYFLLKPKNLFEQSNARTGRKNNEVTRKYETRPENKFRLAITLET